MANVWHLILTNYRKVGCYIRSRTYSKVTRMIRNVGLLVESFCLTRINWVIRLHFVGCISAVNAFETVSPALVKSCNGMKRNSMGGNQRMSLQKCANFSDCGPKSVCATDPRIQPEYPVLLSMLSGEFCLRLKPYLVVKISFDVHV